MTLPLKLAVLPLSSKLTVALLVTKFEVILAVFVLKELLLVMLFANKFPPIFAEFVNDALLPLINALLVTLPLDSMMPSTRKLPVILAMLPILKLLAVTLPLLKLFHDKLLNVAAPKLGVVKFALGLTTIFPPTIEVVTLSVFAEISVPIIAIPLPAVYAPA